MTKSTLVLGFVCLSCLVGTAHAVNDRTQKLLEAQSLNAPPAKVGPQSPNAPSNVNARPSYGPTAGVFSPPSTPGIAKVPAGATAVPVPKH
jgi:hypothetical protein